MEERDTGSESNFGIPYFRRLFGTRPEPVEVSYAGASHPGRVRRTNEDNFAIVRRRRTRDVLLTSLNADSLPAANDEAYVFVVADGMGGYAAGEIASQAAIEVAWQIGATELKWPMIHGKHESLELESKLQTYGKLMDHFLREMVNADPDLEGMGTTFVAAYSLGMEVFVGNIGDSRAYVFRDHELLRLTRDHTLAEQLIERGVMEPDTPEADQFSHILVNCLGGSSEGAVAEIHHVTLRDGDLLLLCTDGLTDMLPDHEIAAVIDDRQSPDQAVQSLIDLALEAGGEDNVTVVIGEYHQPSTADAENATTEEFE
ncbi:PP2C family protein-serine/threonine phosphatase [Thalassoroseus pseudoceratinae]|uniref:PP2C family protein-serine/threonine phosphatase n=1 Tax=Thalassoroseus pseudoceratinae TaxID=2713176 RepID=UPI00142388C5|nr:protein phosphatase 2C domain-containing protein [Thalassoroseus pseudoceratinae]